MESNMISKTFFVAEGFPSSGGSMSMEAVAWMRVPAT